MSLLACGSTGIALWEMNIDGLRIFCCLRRPNLQNHVENEDDQSPDVVLDKQFIGNVWLL